MGAEPHSEEKASLFGSRLWGFFDRVSLAGTEGYPLETRQRLRVINVGVYLIAAVTINYILLYGLFGAWQHTNLIFANLFLFVVALSVPFLHRFHDHAGVLAIVIAEFITMFYLMSQVGSDAGIQLNYIGFAAGVFLAIELSRIKLILTLVFASFLLSAAGWFLFPPEKAAVVLDEALLANIYVNSVAGTVGIVSFVVYYAFNQVRVAKAETENLLRNILPESIADRLKANPEETIADSCPEATVLFADLVDFTPLSRALGAEKLVSLLNEIFRRFDAAADELGVEKIKTIGDAYMVVGGLPEPRSDHAKRIAEMALRMIKELDHVNKQQGRSISLRIGISCGPVMAGVIGKRKFFYDVWGDTVNIASRLESHGEDGKIHISSELKRLLEQDFDFESRGVVNVKGAGPMETWFLTGLKSES